jgi:hypothetical protein
LNWTFIGLIGNYTRFSFFLFVPVARLCFHFFAAPSPSPPLSKSTNTDQLHTLHSCVSLITAFSHSRRDVIYVLTERVDSGHLITDLCEEAPSWGRTPPLNK